jgi:molybdate-binding protein
MVEQTGRCDLAAVMRVLGVLVASPVVEGPADAALEALRSKLDAAGVQFLGIDDDHARFSVHREEHPPVSTRQLGELLGEIRQAWLG